MQCILGGYLLFNRVRDAVGASGNFSRSSFFLLQELSHVLLLFVVLLTLAKYIIHILSVDYIKVFYSFIFGGNTLLALRAGFSVCFDRDQAVYRGHCGVRPCSVLFKFWGNLIF